MFYIIKYIDLNELPLYKRKHSYVSHSSFCDGNFENQANHKPTFKNRNKDSFLSTLVQRTTQTLSHTHQHTNRKHEWVRNIYNHAIIRANTDVHRSILSSFKKTQEILVPPCHLISSFSAKFAFEIATTTQKKRNKWKKQPVPQAKKCDEMHACIRIVKKWIDVENGWVCELDINIDYSEKKNRMNEKVQVFTTTTCTLTTITTTTTTTTQTH